MTRLLIPAALLSAVLALIALRTRQRVREIVPDWDENWNGAA